MPEVPIPHSVRPALAKLAMAGETEASQNRSQAINRFLSGSLVELASRWFEPSPSFLFAAGVLLISWCFT
jgi:hypothetical protein